MKCRSLCFAVILGLISQFHVCAATSADFEILPHSSGNPNSVTIVGNKYNATVLVDPQDYPVVQLAANLFADDAQRVTGHRLVVTNSPANAPEVIIAGTIGHSALIDSLATAGKLKDLDQIQGHWEATLWQIVENPLPNVKRALVIVGSDRRGTAYGFMRLSEKIGVSPWYWWADVPAQHHDALTVSVPSPQVDEPGVKYRGFFINDEDWGLNPWASKTFDPQFGNIGPKTYEKVFELLLRLRLNYIWPAMHACSAEFGSVPENAALADKYGIVVGSSHCEPMLYNNVHWKENTLGRWNYSLNRNALSNVWEITARARGQYEAVWPLGIRGIHDSPMERPPTRMADKITLMTQVINDQRGLIDQYVSKQWGPVAQCFVPYKEVLPIYDAGLKVPDDVTLIWTDDNFGYIRRFSSPSERQRSGGAGIYWHMEYYGSPHSYSWMGTTAPAFMWEELHKAWENDARKLWVLNVGGIKPREIGIDYFSRLAWNPDGFNSGGERRFLDDFAARNFGQKYAQRITDLLMSYYRLGAIRKPELMDRDWALALPPEQAKQLETEYTALLADQESLSTSVPAAARDAYQETIGFPATVLAETGLIFMADRNVQEDVEPAANQKKISQLRDVLASQVHDFNTQIADGKWNRVMPGMVTGKDLPHWNSQVRWPWGETAPATTNLNSNMLPAGQSWRDAATADYRTVQGPGHWDTIEGLGPSGRAVSLQPAALSASWGETDTNAPALEFNFSSAAGDAAAFVDFLPTFRIYPGMKLRVAVSVDNGQATTVEVPGSSGAENENGSVRSNAVQDNDVRVQIPLPNLTAGKHVFTIRAIDPGAVIDRISLP